MKKLQNVISELTAEDFTAIESRLESTGAEKFLGLLRLYRRKQGGDSLEEQLGVSSGALYALKSRLYDRIQSHLSGNLFSSSDQVLLKIHEIPDMCYGKPREIAIAFLLKLEKDLKQLDMHNELVLVYSALKKMNLYSDAYFQYSQLYNKHIAYNLSIEKSEEILGSFNRTLRQYDFSRRAEDLDQLRFLKDSIAQHLALHQSRQVEIIKHLVDLQLYLLCPVPDENVQPRDLLDRCRELLGELPESSPLKPWMLCLDYLYFEFFFRTRQMKSAEAYYARLSGSRAHLLLMCNVVVCSFFPVTEQLYLEATGQHRADPDDMKHDPADLHAVIALRVARAVSLYFQSRLREAAALLNGVLNEHGMKDTFHIATEIRLMLIFIYLRQREHDLAGRMARNLARKIKSDHPDYRNVLHLCRVFTEETAQKPDPEVVSEQFLLFEGRNKGPLQVLRPFVNEMRRIYMN